ncbi:MFS general substrate transporter [Setomelanomma holmii]|uniref:MFS general substrate transporter n=1 Tax=Setomelanomma holmii TaxID=210430 RepID=A0A9P4LLA4_9PLEO|nr:MFS general substrate transporter [Setomelanomma holmii]
MGNRAPASEFHVGIQWRATHLIVPAAATPAAYHKILAQLPQIIEQHKPDLIVHKGLDADSGTSVFKVERQAPKEGYHEFPNIDRKVFTRGENKTTFADHEDHSTKMKNKGKTQGGHPVDVQISDDVGTYVCGFQYYASMINVQKRTGKRNVAFFHVPLLETEQDIAVGVKVAEELIRALVEVLGWCLRVTHVLTCPMIGQQFKTPDARSFFNIGNARLYGSEDGLGLTGDQYQIAVSILFVTYMIFETPSNMIIKRMQPARYLAGLVFIWGLVATFSTFVDNFASLVACRLLLGMFEAGLFPGVILYLSMFYNKRNLALCQAMFYGTSTISGALGGLVAYATGELDGAGGRSGWPWIIAINGISTVLTAFVTPAVLPTLPRLRKIGQTRSAQEMSKNGVMDGVKDWKTYTYAIAQFVGLGMLYSLSVFLPTIIDGMGGGGWTRQEVQALTIPFYTVDQQQQSPPWKRAYASGMQITIGNISGVASPSLYSQSMQPTYFPGYSAMVGLLTLGIALYVTPHLHFRRENKKKREGKYDYLMEGKTEEEITEMGENNPMYLYTI